MVVSVNQSPDLSDAAFACWQDTIEERLGLQLPDHRRSFLKTCLSIRMREVGFDDYLTYHEFVMQGDRGLIEWNQLIDRITVQETRFFRDPAALALVKDYLVRRLKRDESALSVWSVGCSSGEETYSLAILIEEVLAKHESSSDIRYGITGTDVSKKGLKAASEGKYALRRLETLDKRLVDRYFTDVGGSKQVVKSTRDRACFVRLNLLELARSPLNNLDVIYCQNVLIYFRKWRRKDIVSELASRLKPGGILVLGLGEIVDWNMPDLTRVPGERALAYIKRK
ncbi:CheR family methyltransferase [Reinekea marina]|uniref:CheR family methyltransferase n=1 Tax=Reinekea marina TaxID=1310421 RepID=A0ABV7WS43_9GAMM|nr:CheR family methyltransferase [Reinekea marina]MBU2863462.1 protein-glutamate O-methyltransferase CheR [Reinekea forsetii]MDN3650655.1 CheR family methyltransferase [Reinekea marina]